MAGSLCIFHTFVVWSWLFCKASVLSVGLAENMVGHIIWAPWTIKNKGIAERWKTRVPLDLRTSSRSTKTKFTRQLPQEQALFLERFVPEGAGRIVAGLRASAHVMGCSRRAQPLHDLSAFPSNSASLC